MSVVARIIGTIIRETWGGVNTSTPGDDPQRAYAEAEAPTKCHRLSRSNFRLLLLSFRQIYLFFSGYVLDSLVENRSGFTAQLNLAGRPCDAFGHDILNLTIQVSYETTSRCVSVSVPALNLHSAN